MLLSTPTKENVPGSVAQPVAGQLIVPTAVNPPEAPALNGTEKFAPVLMLTLLRATLLAENVGIAPSKSAVTLTLGELRSEVSDTVAVPVPAVAARAIAGGRARTPRMASRNEWVQRVDMVILLL